MAQVSLAKTLSGPEALDSMLHEVRNKLRMNGRFLPHMAYPGYRAVVKVEFYPAASFIPDVQQTVEVQGGFIGFDGIVLSETATVDTTIEIPVRPPNQVREEADMPLPVLADDGKGGTVEKWVKGKQAPKTAAKLRPGIGPEPALTLTPTALPVTHLEAMGEGLSMAQREQE